MNAYADDACPHFPALLALARSYAADRKPVLGICLGGQLLARAWGAQVHIGTAPEFGVVTLTPTPEAAADPLLAGATAPVPAMQWHDDTFDLPAGAVPLLTGTACRNQAFRVAEVVYGFQCHFEADRQDMVEWAAYRRDVYGDRDLAAEITEQARVHGDGRRGVRPAGGGSLARSGGHASRALSQIEARPSYPLSRNAGEGRGGGSLSRETPTPDRTTLA